VNSLRILGRRGILATLIAALVWLPVSGPEAASSAPRTTSSAAVARKTETPPTGLSAVLGKAYRFDRGGWTYVHLEGAPHDIGFQHGYLLAPEIADAFAMTRLEMTHDSSRNWEFFRRAAREMIWPKIDAEYQAELQGIVDGLQARKTKLDLDDIVAFNSFSELPDYYVPWLNRQVSARNNTQNFRPAANVELPGHCSAFVANGSWTKDGVIVMAHSNWTRYIEGARWKIIFDIAPQQGNRFLMDGFPGAIASDDDFGVNSAGLMISETTIADFRGFDPNGKAEFVRARKAMQYANSIDDFTKIMIDGNNGGYANDWLLGDRRTIKIARFELGLKHQRLWRTMDGYYSGANFPSDPDVIRDETVFDPNDPASSANARRLRWDQLMQENKGKIDVALAETFLGDHYDTYSKAESPSRRTLCGHYDADDALVGVNSGAFNPYGAVSGKAMDSQMAERMTFIARIGHPCGSVFDAAKYLSEHKQYSWQAPALRDLIPGPWTQFQSGDHAGS
jgi:phospholipase B-like protein